LFAGRPDWILSGSLDAWGRDIAVLFDLVVFLDVPADVRLARLRHREHTTFGQATCLPGGSRHHEHEEFIAWASGYKDATKPGRTRARHQAWFSTLACPVLRLDGTEPLDTLANAVAAALPWPLPA
jgi:thymidylate kinase